MMFKPRIARAPQWLALAVALLMPTQLWAGPVISAQGGWLRLVPPVSSNSAGYVTLQNASKQPVDLLSARSDNAATVELHTVIREGELMRMQQLERITVPAQAAVTLQPGAHHLMFIGLKAPLKENQQVPVTLTFSNGETLQLSLPVKPDADAGGDDDHHQHHHH